MSVVRDWLPKDALTGDRVCAALAGTVNQWAEAHFRNASAGLHFQAERRFSIGEESISVSLGGVRVSLSDTGKQSLLAAGLDATVDDKPITSVDGLLLAAMATALSEDLGRRLEALLDRQQWDEADQLRLDLLLDGREVGTVCVSRQGMTALVRASLRQEAKPGAPLARRSTALAGVNVPLEAVIGTATLAIDDVRGLAPGDVLLLDRSLAEGANVRVEGSNAAILHGEFSTDSGCNSLIIAA